MIGMDWLQWVIVAGCAAAVFVVVEAEKSFQKLFVISQIQYR